MTTLYEDSYLVCDEDALTIHYYYFPIGSKRIPYQAIERFVQEPMNFWTGGGRLWGMGLSPDWFHLDLQRPSKSRCIILFEKDNWVRSVITPQDQDAVLGILQEKVSANP